MQFFQTSVKKKQKNTKEIILKTFTLYLRSSFFSLFFFFKMKTSECFMCIMDPKFKDTPFSHKDLRIVSKLWDERSSLNLNFGGKSEGITSQLLQEEHSLRFSAKKLLAIQKTKQNFKRAPFCNNTCTLC